MPDTFPDRRIYEGAGGWTDGRLGQAYDLIAAVLREKGQDAFRNSLLKHVEDLDDFLGRDAA